MIKKKDANQFFYVQQSSPRSLWLRLLDGILILVTIALAAALVMAYMAQYISPERVWYLAFFGLSAQFLFLGNFLLFLIWTVRWRAWALIPMITMLMGVGDAGKHFQVRFARQYHAQDAVPGQLRVLSYNVHGFFYKNETQHSGYLDNLDSIASYIASQDPDVICLQEYETMSLSDVAFVDSLFADWSYRNINITVGGSHELGHGNAIFSRYPIISTESILFENSMNSALIADIRFNDDTLRVINAHLQSTQIDKASKSKVENLEIIPDSSSKELIRSVGSSLKQNYIRRACQVDSLSQRIAQCSYPIIVAGDFNDTPISYTYCKIRGDKLVDTFVEQGDGFAYTYNELFSVLRIDYILHSPSFETLSYRSDKLPWSDHNPVVATMVKKPTSANH